MTPFVRLDDTKPVLAILSQISIFGGVTDDQLGEILHYLDTTVIEKGAVIFSKGDQPTHIYIIVRGRAELMIEDGGVCLRKHSLGVGEAFGEASLMSMHAHSATAIASEECEVLGLSRHALIQLRHEDLAVFALLMANIARELARRLKFTDSMLLDYMRLHRDATAGEAGEPSP